MTELAEKMSVVEADMLYKMLRATSKEMPKWGSSAQMRRMLQRHILGSFPTREELMNSICAIHSFFHLDSFSFALTHGFDASINLVTFNCNEKYRISINFTCCFSEEHDVLLFLVSISETQDIISC